MFRIILLPTVFLSAVMALQECGQTTGNNAANALANANGNNNAMVENANSARGPATNRPTTNPDGGNSALPPGGDTGGANSPAGGPPAGGNPPASNR